MMPKVMMMVAELIVAFLGASDADLVCWEAGPQEPSVRYVCQVEYEGVGAFVYTNGGSEPVGVAYYAAIPDRPIEASDEAKAFVAYIEAVLEDGDTMNDWLTHLPLDRQNLAAALGEIVAEAFGENTIAGAEMSIYMIETLKANDPTSDPWVETLPTAQRLAAQAVGEMLVSLDFRG